MFTNGQNQYTPETLREYKGVKNKFFEVLEFSYDIINGIKNPQQYFDNRWNTCETKLVDNAIIMM
jgi:hypothetical protein